jgi:hypothetical protein
MRSMTQLTNPFVADLDPTTALVPMGGRPGGFRVDLDGRWSSLVGVHGSDRSASTVRAAEFLAPDREVRAASTGLLRNGTVVAEPSQARLTAGR